MGTEISWLNGFDQTTFDLLNKTFTSSVFDQIMPIFSSVVIWAVPFGMVWLAFFIFTDRRGRIVALCCFMVLAATDQISSAVIKPAVERVRPCNVVPSTRLYDKGHWITTDKFALTTYVGTYSFPSSHATNMAGQAMYWSYFYPQISPVLIFGAVAVGYSRVYLGFHWPTDVLFGYLLGIIVALMIAYPLRAWVLPDRER